MFPNPQSVLPLPRHPNLEHYRKIAKDLVKGCKSGEPTYVRGWAQEWVERWVNLSGLVITPQLPVRISSWVDDVEAFARRHLESAEAGERACALTAAQFVIARSHGFESWPKFCAHLQSLARASSPVYRFEAAAEAVVHGELATLRQLLSEEPQLIRSHSTREHAATLLHYVSANGVEGYRQRTPSNIVDIAEYLLRSGAEIDATANVYGAACTTLGLAATSIHPERAGLQDSLLGLLLDYGADINYCPANSAQQSIVSTCLGNGRIRAAEFLASRGAHLGLVESAGLGRIDQVESFFDADGSRKETADRSQLDSALLYACEYGRTLVVEFLLAHGGNMSAQSRDGQTALHHAVIGAHLDTVNLLLKYKPSLEITNSYGGTVFGQALWSAAHGGDPDLYVPILEALLAAGAQVPEQHVPINPPVNAWLAQRGSHAESAWRWAHE
jgi:ankyrin repeat protein